MQPAARGIRFQRLGDDGSPNLALAAQQMVWTDRAATVIFETEVDGLAYYAYKICRKIVWQRLRRTYFFADAIAFTASMMSSSIFTKLCYTFTATTKKEIVRSVAGNSKSGRLAQLVRALPSHGRGHWFESSAAQYAKEEGSEMAIHYRKRKDKTRIALSQNQKMTRQ